MIKFKVADVLAAAAAVLFALALRANAGSITNNFDSSADFLANGVLGTMWDGVYLKAGDVTDGTGGTDGSTLQANETFASGYLTVQSTGGGWAGAQDDGFFLYKMVSGDFDVSVENVPSYTAANYTFGGLLVRAANFQNGAPLAAGENWVGLARFQEFGLGDGVRFATNGTDNEFLYTAGDDSDTNTFRFYRITRVGDVFSFYNKTNAEDAWTLQTNITRVDLAGMPMQVGIQQAVYTGNTPVNFFTDFELSGPNVMTTTPPADPSGIVVNTVNSNTVSISWTSGAGSDGSVVLIRANGPITQQPADGFTYTGDTNFASADGVLGGAGVHAVYVGSGSSVTVTGLGANKNTYSVAVLSYSGSGSSTVYDANPATSSFTGPGTLVSVDFTVDPTTIPVGGVAVATLIATYTSGDSYDVSSDAGTTWSSDDTGVVSVTGGILTGISIGSATITVTYNSVTGTNSVNVTAPAFTDDFSVPHDYVADGMPGSAWDGIYLGFGDIPGGGGGAGQTTVASANSVTNNSLVVTANNGAWAADGDDGFLLFKNNVSGDFEAAVHIKSLQRINYQFAGLMARAAESDGAPYGGSENWVDFGEFGEFGFSVESRTAIDGADNQYALNDGDNATDFWLLMRRSGNTFTFFRKVNQGDNWNALPAQTITRDDLAGVPVQVGLFEAMFSSSSGTASFDSFMLDAAGLNSGTPPVAASALTNIMVNATTMTLNWTPGDGSTGSVVVVRADQPINQQPLNGVVYTADASFGAGSDLGGGNYVVYAGSGSSVTVSNLSSGTTYYAAVYSYGGPEGSPVYNTSVPVDGINTVVMGTPESITVVGPSHIPVGGIGKATVYVNYSGGFVAKANGGNTFSSDNTNAIITVGTNSLLTGLANGTATITAIHTEAGMSFTNSTSVSVMAPTFVDNFSVDHDYKANGVAGTTWDGVYEAPGAIPGTTYVSDPAASIQSADANTTSNNWLTVSTLNVGWEFDQNDGFFLFKKVTGDFQVAVHIGNTLIDADTNVLATYNNPGLLARAYTGDGSPFVGGTNESWISWTRFDEFGIGTYARRTLSNGTQQNGQPAVADGNYWLLMVRDRGTNFSFYQRVLPTDPWKPAPNGTTYSVTNFAGQPMQVGLLAGAFDSGNVATSQFGDFMLDVVVTLPDLQIGSSNGNVTLSWPETAAKLQMTTGLSPASWQDVNELMTTNNGTVSVTLPATNATSYFRLSQ